MLIRKGNSVTGTRSKRKGHRAVNLEGGDLVRFRPLYPDQTLPLLAEPSMAGVKLGEWLKDHFHTVDEKLHQHGAVLFRGFNILDVEQFGEFMNTLGRERLPYMESSTPREQVGQWIYTSTVYPPEETIATHSENSGSMTFPMKLWFFCEEASETGGETPIGDARRILKRLPESVQESFKRKGWLLIRNYGDGLGIPWQKAFKTETKEGVEAYGQSADVTLEWRDGDRLRTRQVRSAILAHPQTSEEVWFNHVSFWHMANLKDKVLQEMVRAVGVEGLPYNTYYGDGEVIPDDVAKILAEAYVAEKVLFPWQKGDIMVIDNMLCVHGREPYTGTRKVRVAMTDPYARPDFTPEANA